jgi:uncharacterized membrane protein YbhN (UPF0104 family)
LVIPLSLAGLGVREISLTVVLVAAGVPTADAVAVSIVSRCFIWIISLVGGGWFVLRRSSTQAQE